MHSPDSTPDAVTALSIDRARREQRSSSHPTTKVGALLWRPNPAGGIHVLAEGHNGFAKGVRANPPRLKANIDLDLHAETAAIAQAARDGKAVKGAILTSTHCCCPNCAAVAKEAGIAKLIVDGRQKLRPNFFKNGWVSQKRISLAIFDDAGIRLEVPGLRLLKDGELDWRMTPQENEGGQGFCLSDSPLIAPAASGIDLYRKAILAEMPSLSRRDESWQATPHHPEGALPKRTLPALADIMDKVDQEILSQRRTGQGASEHAAVLLGRGGAPHLFAFGKSPAEIARIPGQPALDPATLLVAHAARDGVRMKGGKVYLTHFPDPLGAIMLIGAGVRSIAVDGRNLPERLDEKTAGALLKSWTALREANIPIEYLGAPGQEAAFTRLLAESAPPELIAILGPEKPKITPPKSFVGREKIAGSEIVRH